MTAWRLVAEVGDTQEFRVEFADRSIDIALWGDGSWVTVWAVDNHGHRADELAHWTARDAGELVNVISDAGCDPEEVRDALESLWASSNRAGKDFSNS